MNEDRTASTEDANSYAFRLFSTSKVSTTTHDSGTSENPPLRPNSKAPLSGITRIKLDTPPPASASDGDNALQTHCNSRPLSFYFAGDSAPDERRKYQESAVDGADVRKRAEDPWYGWMMKWRIAPATFKPVSNKSVVDTVAGPEPGEHGNLDVRTSAPSRKSRKGKKARLKIRIKLRAREEEKRKRAGLEKEKEEYLRQKKAKVNRAKQIKKREKARKGKELLKSDAHLEGGRGT